MNLDRRIRLIAGTFILLSLGLALWVSPYWLLFTAFVGANLFQSALTRWCLLEDILVKLGVRRPADSWPPPKADQKEDCSGPPT